MNDFCRHLLASSPAVIYTCKVGGDYGATYISENVFDQLGYRPNEFLDDPGFWKDHIHPEDLPGVLSGLESIFRDGHHVHEYRFRTKSSEYRWMRDELHLVCNPETGADELVGSWLDITDRKLIEENYRRFAGLTSDYLHYCTRKGTEPFRIQWVDGAVNPISGYSTQDVLELGCWLPLVHPEDRQTVASYLFSLVPGDKKTIEFRIVTKGQKVRWVLENCRCEAGSSEGELLLFGAVTDITERRQLETKREELLKNLWERSETLNTVLNTIPQSVFWKDASGRYLGCNKNFAAAVGLESTEKIVGLTDYDLPWPREDADAYVADDCQVIQTNSAKLHIIEPLQQSDGRRLWIDTSKVPLRDASGKPFGVIGIYNDVTERRRMEKSLRDSEDFLQEASRIARLGRWRWDIFTDLIECSNIGLEIFGLPTTADKNPIDNFLMAIHPEDRSIVKAALRDSLENGNEYSVEYRIVLGDGSLRYAQGKGQVQYAADGKPVCMVGTVLDVTNQKLVEERLQESDRIKGEFIATASHELRTPLSIIQGYSELLLENADLDFEQQREFLSVIHDKVQILEKIVDDLLDVGRIETGRTVCLELEQINIVKQIHQVVAHFQREASKHHFSVELPGEEIALSVDRMKINQVLENLLSNAVKFSPKGGEIFISGKVLDGFFHFMVADEGVGIPPEKQKTIYDKFYRINSSDTAAPGFGIGLYLVKQIIEAHGGKVWSESNLGKGAKFFFTLPL